MKILDTLKDILHIGRSDKCGGHEDPTAGTAGAPAAQAPPGTPEDGAAPGEDVRWEAAGCFQIGLYDFTTEEGVIGFYLDPENRWLQLARTIFSAEDGIEAVYQRRMEEMRGAMAGARLGAKLKKLEQDEDVAAYGRQLEIPNIDSAVTKAVADDLTEALKKGGTNAGRDPFPARLAFGILAAQSILGLPDRGICRMVSESPYLQAFLGYTSFSVKNTVDPTCLVHFRKRFDMGAMREINSLVRKQPGITAEYGAAAMAAAGPGTGGAGTPCPAEGGSGHDGPEAAEAAPENSGTLILDATCGPASIRYPQDFSLLNEGRADLEKIIDRLCHDHGFEKPRTYPRVIQKKAQDLSKSKKKTSAQIRHVVRLELNAIKRNLGHIDRLLSNGSPVELTPREVEKIQVIRAVYAQQLCMHETGTHTVTRRIVSIALPFVRPIPRGKAARPTEFGPKYDIAVDGDDFSWVTSFSFENFCEGTHLRDAAEDYREKTGRYPKRILADQIYRTDENRRYCKENGIRLSGPPLGRKPKDGEARQVPVSVEKQDMVDRISVERHFSREKRCFGIAEIVEKTEETIGHAVGMAVFLDNFVPVDF